MSQYYYLYVFKLKRKKKFNIHRNLNGSEEVFRIKLLTILCTTVVTRKKQVECSTNDIL